MGLTKWGEFFTGFFHRKASGLVRDLGVSVFAYLVPLFGASITNIVRLDGKLNCSSVHSEQLIEADSVIESTDSDVAELFIDSSSEEDSTKLVFKFQSFEDFVRNNGGKDQSFVAHEPVLKTSFCRFLEESEGVNSEIKKMCESSKVEILENEDDLSDGFLSHQDFLQPKCVCVQVDRTESGLKGTHGNDGLEKPLVVEDEDTRGQKLDEIDTKLESDEVDVEEEEESELSLKSESIVSETVSESDEVDVEQAELSLKCKSIISDVEEVELDLKSESESMISDDGLVDLSYRDESISDRFLSDGDSMPNSELHSDNEFSLESLENYEDCLHDDHEADAVKELHSLLKSQSKVWTSMENEIDDLEEEYKGIERELHSKKGENMLGDEFLTDDDFIGDGENPDSENDNWEEDEDLETLWEHQDILQQLSNEIENVRATGLPTIDEDAEFSEFSENLQPWKIEEKFKAGETFNLVHKFYRSYWERMRKLDILSYQKMYAIGLKQSKDPLKSVSNIKFETSSSTLFLSLRRTKNSQIEAEPTMKFVRELQNDLELVYVGQMCLSWEILHWQYDKAMELWEADPHCLRRFNLVYGEFQQFQILLQRFVEDERYQGPRVQSYINCRRSLHNLLLQVPVIREDKRDKKRASSGDDPMTSDMLVEAMEESIRTFWQFVKADKHQSASRKTIHCELQGPADSELLYELTKSLHKKEKKVKDILRTSNSILMKLKRHRGDVSADQVLCFFSQVDIKLVARVLGMPLLTRDQLQWCANKLNSINFVNGRIQVEPAFSLFPC